MGGREKGNKWVVFEQSDDETHVSISTFSYGRVRSLRIRREGNSLAGNYDDARQRKKLERRILVVALATQ